MTKTEPLLMVCARATLLRSEKHSPSRADEAAQLASELIDQWEGRNALTILMVACHLIEWVDLCMEQPEARIQ